MVTDKRSIFLGARVCRALVARGHKVVALVMAPDDAAARDRLGGHAGDAIAGDLTLPHFGLDGRAWRRLSSDVGCVVHLGASVELSSDLERLLSVNVGGTATRLNLARETGARFVYASTLSVFVASDRRDPVFYETDDAGTPCRLAGGYAQSKWIAERAVRRAGVSGCIIRYGLLVGARASGDHPGGDWLARFIRDLAGLGLVPEGLERAPLAFDATPIDDACMATMTILDHLPHDGLLTAHVASAQPVAIGRLLKALHAERVALHAVPLAEFLSRASRASLAFGLARALDAERFDRHRALDIFAASGVRFDGRIAAGFGVDIPGVDDDDLRRLVRSVLRSAPAAQSLESGVGREGRLNGAVLG